MRIAILLATYNGEKYLEEQLESILNQSFEDWVVYIRDDCSMDGTVDILKHYCSRYPDKFILIDNLLEVKLGSGRNFMELLYLVESNYYMFCDQDDVWLSNKIEISFDAMLEIEKFSNDKPILIHTDLIVVDEFLNTMQDSYWKVTKFDLHSESLVTNIVTGCTLLFNSKVKNLAFPYPKELIMHDYWLFLLAITNDGVIVPIYEPTVLYRQHLNNVLGVNVISSMTWVLSFFTSLKSMVNNNKRQYKMIKQCNKNMNAYKFIFAKFIESMKYYVIRK